ncbi:MAG: lysine--tRNA ligase [Armatimonadetes bacterium]|nr:lysine--tRNA ligase [Armatimonadota bacterium]
MDEQQELTDQITVRREKLAELRRRGVDPFTTERYPRTHTTTEAAAAFREWEQVGEAADPPTAAIAGRVTSRRIMGRKAAFLDLSDQHGRLQLYVREDHLGPEAFTLLEFLDVGDIIGARGPVFRTRAGEITLDTHELHILTKALRPLPVAKEREGHVWGGLQDVEQRYRQRYVDLAIHPQVRDQFLRRSRIISEIRRFYEEHGYVEVETPVLQTVAGGAAARPFVTYHHALDLELHLRISLELFLKRLLVGGVEKVFEIGRVFRNEGVSTRHNPEFTLLESYEAYANLEDIQDLVEQLICRLAVALWHRPAVPFRGEWIDVTPPWPRLPLLEGIARYAGIGPAELEEFDSARHAAERAGLDVSQETHLGGLLEKLHERFTQPHLEQPTFITDFPIETSPLAKKRPDNPRLTRRFEAYLATQEIANAFSEINDPIDQRERFLVQARLRAAGDLEAHPMDEDFLRALEYGMPPAGGLGIGVDRLVMVLTDTESIRDVILFPLMRPER